MKLSKFKPLFLQLQAKKLKAGRNNFGRVTVRHQGGGHKQHYRKIDWFRQRDEVFVSNFEYDPNRNVTLAKITSLNHDKKSAFSYIIYPKGLKLFDKLKTLNERKKNFYLRIGDASVLYNFEAGDFIHNVESIPGQGGLFARSAGTFCQILQNSSKDYAKVRLPSGSQRLISLKAKATLGIVGCEEHRYRNLEKAGRSRWLNKRPSVRGVAMNPVDHPHGGGQGKTKGGRPSVTPWSWPTKGQPTRKKKNKNLLILTGRLQKKKIKRN